MTYLKFFLPLAFCAGFTSCQSINREKGPDASPGKVVHSRDVKTSGVVLKKPSAPKTGQVANTASTTGKVIQGVRTTAYTHTEKDHLKHGSKNALDSKLKFGDVRSAAADWSVYPVGTTFKVQGEPYVYVIDDYGSALVGTRTLDLYKPTAASMRSWGVRKVNIDVLEWGSYQRSLAILKGRDSKGHGAVHRMLARLLDLGGRNDMASAN